MSYKHSNEFESGDSMSGSSSGDSSLPARGKPKSTGTGSSNRAGSSASSHSAPSTAQHRCSYCGQFFKREDSKNMPFCSKRCQHIDLGMWLNESYGMPHEGESSLDSYGVQDEDI